ncbi:hypothetical protein K6U06_18285 [Acidiferrimicrobium sp. IK]|uniref:hypothetical protein n=1 Tax=Acidiferrimicrobium sp. IK TaxID=2871700 RepID=UPI0021CB08FD|nr:hypothetical protein [Acidiferrimicrobium sp. IK]MCU4186321.1 hypothetical protein [Acidiferrimicrobium sp. IK]
MVVLSWCYSPTGTSASFDDLLEDGGDGADGKQLAAALAVTAELTDLGVIRAPK